MKKLFVLTVAVLGMALLTGCGNKVETYSFENIYEEESNDKINIEENVIDRETISDDEIVENFESVNEFHKELEELGIHSKETYHIGVSDEYLEELEYNSMKNNY